MVCVRWHKMTDDSHIYARNIYIKYNNYYNKFYQKVYSNVLDLPKKKPSLYVARMQAYRRMMNARKLGKNIIQKCKYLQKILPPKKIKKITHTHIQKN